MSVDTEQHQRSGAVRLPIAYVYRRQRIRV
jgi:hypothetical protein